MDNNDMIKMKLTPQEVFLIESIRSMKIGIGARKTDEQTSEDYMQKYMDMDDNEFIDAYAEAVGDDVILSVLQDGLDAIHKWDAIWEAIDQDVLDELFEAYVSVDSKRELFLNTQDREELCKQMVDLVMDGDWNPEN